ncbi:MAG TPA: hypothetical protein VD833_15400 [Vicinamibacterales bacterium]|nr:hypothetical protein [Vicinamibacterales bacterium]
MRRAIICILTIAAGAATAWARQPPTAEGWVVLTLDDYHALRGRAFPPTPDPQPPPVDAALTRVDYELRLGADSVTGQARLTVDVLKEGWTSVQIPPAILVRAALLDGQPTTLVDGTPPRVLLSKPGRAVLTLDIVVPVTAAGGSETIALPSSGSAVSAVSLVVPRADVDLVVSGGFIVEPTSAAGESRWLVHGHPAQPMRLSWKRRVDDRRQSLPLRLRARLTGFVALGEESSALTLDAQIDVVQGAAADVSLTLPEGVSVNRVSGSTVADWRQESGTLTVVFVEPMATAATFAVQGEFRAPREGPVSVPIVRLPAADRETGGLAVDVIGAGEIGEAQVRALERADAGELGEPVSGRDSPSIVAFRFMPVKGSEPRALSVRVSRYTPQAVLVANVEDARYDALVAEDGKRLVRARYAVRNNQRSFLAVALPADSILWSARLGGQPVRPGVAADGSLLLPLLKGRANEDPPLFAVEVMYLQRGAPWSDRGSARLELPAIDLPVSRTGFSLHHSPRYRLELLPGTFRLEDDTRPVSPVFSSVEGRGGGAIAPPPAASQSDAAAQSMFMLIDQFRKDAGRTVGGIVPIDVDLPDFGPALFLAAELTAESRALVAEVTYRRTDM